MNDWISAIGSLGFPICCCLGLGFYVKYQTDKYDASIREMQREHKEEVSKMTEALNNNTLALQKLIDKIDNVVE